MVRLAYERGNLTRRSVNKVQYWALSYWFYLTRRVELEDREELLERQTMLLNPEMWVRIYKDKILGDLVTPDGEGEMPVTEEDMADLDRYMEQQEQAWKKEHEFQQIISGQTKRTMSGATTPLDWPQMQAEPLQWGPWT